MESRYIRNFDSISHQNSYNEKVYAYYDNFVNKKRIVIYLYIFVKRISDRKSRKYQSYTASKTEHAFEVWRRGKEKKKKNLKFSPMYTDTTFYHSRYKAYYHYFFFFFFFAWQVCNLTHP